MKPFLRRAIVVIIIFSVVAAGSVVFWVGTILTSPAPRNADTIPINIPFKVFRTAYRGTLKVAGWAAKNSKSEAGVLLVHGIRGHRGNLVERSQFLFEAGYSVVLIDLPSHGESDGDRITLGYEESLGVIAASNYMKNEMGVKRVGVIGSSLGGASVLLGKEKRDYDAVILEAVFSNIENAIGNRVSGRLGSIGSLVAPLLLWQIKPRLGLRLSDLSPVKKIRTLNSPVFVIGGEMDDRTTKEETVSLFEAAKSPKQLWIVPGARHVDMYRHAKSEYKKRVLSFFGRYLLVAPEKVGG